MTLLQKAIVDYAKDARELALSDTTREESYYPAIKSLLIAGLRDLGLPSNVRTSTTERRAGGGIDLPDVALYDSGGDFVIVCGEVKTPTAEIHEMARSTDRNDQVGRYLALTRVVLLSNVRGFGLLTVDPDFIDPGPVPPEMRRLEAEIELWPSVSALKKDSAARADSVPELLELLETAVTRFAPIADPETLARVLARQARRAKASLPEEFGTAVAGLAEDFGKALGITFEGAEGQEFFRSSLVQTVFYGLFAGWTLWVRSESEEPFRWRDLPDHLKIPFLGELFYEIQNPRRINELGLRPHLDQATETLGRVHQAIFFERLTLPHIEAGLEPSRAVATAILYFYEPFLETFDPDLRKQLGVWYTPPEIVRYQVRKVDALLRDRLGCERGFADDDVVVLDPACGTGAYLIEVLLCMAETLRREGVGAELGETLLLALRRRVLGFEILTAPFVIAHLQLYLILSELGAQPNEHQRPGVYLTNALTGWEGGTQFELHFPELQAELDASHAVKRDARIIVILGNPPYNRFAGAPMAEESDLVDQYKGIERDAAGRQVGQSQLFVRWRVRKQLLDDLYIRFFRLAEKRIGLRAEHGVVSFISNSSYLAGRSHPIMRASLTQTFDEIWVDNLNGDKYKTGKIIPRDEPGAGGADQSVFSTTNDPRGIQVGVAISTLLKTGDRTGGAAVAHYRDFWGRASEKRGALLNALEQHEWPEERRSEAQNTPAGPREYVSFSPTGEKRWKLVPYDAVGGFEDWPALDELFPAQSMGINPNRGLDSSIIDQHRAALAERMREYFSSMSFQEFQRRHPALATARARYEPQAIRDALRERSRFREERIVPYLIFPFDVRWIYYEYEAKLISERSPELWDNLEDNEFLIAVPQPRKHSETRPMVASSLFGLHLHDRGSVGFLAQVSESPDATPLFADIPGTIATRRANLATSAWTSFRDAWRLSGDRSGDDAARLVRMLFRACLALCHAPNYEEEHRDSLSQDWAHVPIPKDWALFNELVEAGDRLAQLLNPLENARHVIQEILGNAAARLATLERVGGGPVREADLSMTVSYFGAARGGWRQRAPVADEPQHPAWGEFTADLYINDEIFFRHVPARVWSYELGGYPVLKKWLGYRDARRRAGRSLSLEEKDHFRGMVQRIAAILVLQDTLSALYQQCSADAFSALDLCMREA